MLISGMSFRLRLAIPVWIALMCVFAGPARATLAYTADSEENVFQMTIGASSDHSEWPSQVVDLFDASANGGYRDTNDTDDLHLSLTGFVLSNRVLSAMLTPDDYANANLYAAASAFLANAGILPIMIALDFDDSSSFGPTGLDAATLVR